jgi:hypothetical protein
MASRQGDVSVLDLERKGVRVNIDRFHRPSPPVISSREAARIGLIKGQSIPKRVVSRVQNDRGGHIF